VSGPRVVHVASGREWRGGQRQVWLLARALGRTAEFDQIVITSPRSELARRLASAGLPVRHAGWTAALDPRALWATCHEARKDPTRTVLHAHDPHALVLAGLAARVTGARLVVTRRVVFHLRRRGFWHAADRVVAISEAVRRVLVDDGVAADRIAVVPSGVDLDSLRRTRPRGIRSRLGLAEATPIAINVGALTPEKDHVTLLRAAGAARPAAPELRWLLAGEGPERPALERIVSEAGLEDRVHFLGHDPEPRELIRDATLMVHSAVEEGLGTTILDAMALGTPVVATAAGGVAELLAGGAGLLVPVRDPSALAEAALRMLTDATLRSASVARAATRVEQYSDARMAEGMRSVYRSVLSSP
jgi:glycosyltransferase involved in cell wall biosynthesis